MNYWLLFIPASSAFVGWFTNWVILKMLFHPRHPKNIAGFRLQGFFPKKQQQFAITTGKLVSDSFSFENVQQKINDPKNFQRIMPMIEKHVDDFLRIKLISEMPYLGLLIGDKTIEGLKKIFMQEIEILFPQVIGQFATGIQNDYNLEKMITDKINGMSSEKLEKTLYSLMAKELRLAGLLAAGIGFLVGIIQVLFITIFS